MTDEEIVVREEIPPNVGDIRWSPFFHAYVVLVEYVSDAEWYYRMKTGPIRSYKGQINWSEMPLDKPENI